MLLMNLKKNRGHRSVASACFNLFALYPCSSPAEFVLYRPCLDVVEYTSIYMDWGRLEYKATVESERPE